MSESGMSRRALFTLGISRLRKEEPEGPKPPPRPPATASERLLAAVEESDLHWISTKPALALFAAAPPQAGEQVLVVAAEALDDALGDSDALIAVADAAEVEELPFDDEEFDRVFVTYAHQFWPEPRRAVDEVFRVVRPGGMVGLVSWTDERSVGRLLQAAIDWDPEMPPPQAWGLEERVDHELSGHAEAEIAYSDCEVHAEYEKVDHAAAALERALPPVRAALAGFPGADGNALRAHAVRLVVQEGGPPVHGRALLAVARRRS
jgi:SAM-dependent methyltransferase